MLFQTIDKMISDVSDSESESENSFIETNSFKKQKREALLFESIQGPINKILKSKVDNIEEKLKKNKKDDLKILVKRVKKTINVSFDCEL